MKKEKETTGSSYWRTIARLFIKAGSFGTINLFSEPYANENGSGLTDSDEPNERFDDFLLQNTSLQNSDKEQDYYLFAHL